VLVSLNGGAPIEGAEITLNYGETSVEGSGGCNTYGGEYAASGDSLRLSGLYWTERACMEPKGIMEQEQAHLQALNAAARYHVDGDRLELYDEAGTLILAFVTPASGSLAEEETPTTTVAGLSLGCTLEMEETYPLGEPVDLWYTLHNHSDRPLYVLAWYTPLEGIAGEILRVTQDGVPLPYRGILAKRGDPIREEYIAIGPGEAASAVVDLRMGYDLSTPGSYQVQFTTGLQDVTDDASLVPQKPEDHRPQSLSCNTVRFRVVPAPEPPTATVVALATSTRVPPTAVPPTATAVAAATPTPESPTATPTAIEPPAGFRRYVNGASGVSLWVPESWTVIEPGPPHGGSPILQSYPQDKYVGGEPRQPGDTKCDLIIHPPGTSAADVVPQNRSDPPVTVVSEREIVLRSGQPGTRFEVESMGRSLSLVTEVNGRAVVLTCFGELEPFDAIAVTLDAAEAVPSTPSPATEPSAALKQYQDAAAGVSVHVPGDWVVTGIVPSHWATLQPRRLG
jgi:heat shock protein HslJ